MTNVLVYPESASAEAELSGVADMTNDRFTFAPVRIRARFRFVGGQWTPTSVYVFGPVVRKSDGGLSTRDAGLYYTENPWLIDSRDLAELPDWAKAFTAAHAPREAA